MCYRPIRITNNTKDYQPTDKAYVNVPCGTCHECLAIRKNDYQFRILAQMLYRESQNYSAYFFTLTYSDKFLPHFKYHYEGGRFEHDKNSFGWSKREDFDIPCFSKEDINTFCRGIKKELNRRYGVTDVDYMICSEYGGHTSRPHYHGVLLVPNDISPLEVHTLIKKYWSVIKENEYDKYGVPLRQPKGFVMPRVCFGGIDSNGVNHKPLRIKPANFVQAAIYVSKYASKQLDYYQLPAVSVCLSALRKLNDVASLRRFRKCLPFIKTSLHFGECINELFTHETMPSWSKGLFKGNKDVVTRCLQGLESPLHKQSRTTLPFYNMRKLFYDRVKVEDVEFKELVYADGSTSYCYDFGDAPLSSPIVKVRKKHKYIFATGLTCLGQQVLSARYDDSLHRFRDRFMDFKNDVVLNDRLFNKFLEEYGKDNRNLVLDDMFHYTVDDINRLGVYAVVYRDRLIPSHLALYYKHPSKFKPDFRVLSDPTVFNWETLWSYHHEFSKVLEDDEVLELYQLPDVFMFTGKESIYEMCDRSREFYESACWIERDPYCCNCAISEKNSLFFNSMSCFLGMDDILLLLESWERYKKVPRYEANYQKELVRKKAKCLIYKD